MSPANLHVVCLRKPQSYAFMGQCAPSLFIEGKQHLEKKPDNVVWQVWPLVLANLVASWATVRITLPSSPNTNGTHLRRRGSSTLRIALNVPHDVFVEVVAQDHCDYDKHKMQDHGDFFLGRHGLFLQLEGDVKRFYSETSIPNYRQVLYRRGRHVRDFAGALWFGDRYFAECKDVYACYVFLVAHVCSFCSASSSPFFVNALTGMRVTRGSWHAASRQSCANDNLRSSTMHATLAAAAEV